jgi:predicted restriction endonuclease
LANAGERISGNDWPAAKAKEISRLNKGLRPSTLPPTTEAERMVIQRIGQDIFRDALMDYWGRRCPMTSITEPKLLRASHIVPWADSTDEQRLDVYNGLLLSALWDAAFDSGLISFADDGSVLLTDQISEATRATLAITPTTRLNGLRDQHRANLAVHRERNGFSYIQRLCEIAWCK